MILWRMGIKNSNNNQNIKNERKYLKEFLIKIYNDSLIIFSDNIDLTKLSSSDFVIAKLNIYDYENDEKGNPKKVKYFMLLDAEYNKIMNEYSGKLDKYNLLNLFCNIKSRIKRNDKNTLETQRVFEVCYPSYDTIMNDIFIESAKTLRQYIDELIKLDLIKFDYAGDMIMTIEGQKPIRRKANFTYTLFKPGCEIELENAISLFRSQKRAVGWSFLSKEKEIIADEKRSITQKINMLEKLSKLTKSQKIELKQLKKKQEVWKREYDKNNTRISEEEKLKSENPNKPLSEIYDDMGFEAKAGRAYEEEEEYDKEKFQKDIKEEDKNQLV